jgi:hypothetical protein
MIPQTPLLNAIGTGTNLVTDSQQQLWINISLLVAVSKSFFAFWDSQEKDAQPDAETNIKAIFKKRNLAEERLGLFSTWRECIVRRKDDTLMRMLCIAGSSFQ